jgi:isopentenyl-diphosphate delta-isomerase
MSTEKRKGEHLRICAEMDVETGSTWLQDVRPVHKCVPELDLIGVDTSTVFLGKELKMPLVIAALTGGTEEAGQINRDLAEVAEKKGIGFGLGSQRAMIEKPELKSTFYVRDAAPSILLLGNIGITKLKDYEPERIEKACREAGVDALCVHINPAQEIFQNEGDYDFRGCLSALKRLCQSINYPVIAKEVGNGICRESALLLKEAGVSAIDVGGVGGTSWVVVDSIRSGKDATDFREWGIPTAASILEAKHAGLPIIATGGIRSGSDIARAVMLGADVCGIALPFLRVYRRGGKAGVERYIDKLREELRMNMFLTGCKNVAELKAAKHVLTSKLKEWKEQRTK